MTKPTTLEELTTSLNVMGIVRSSVSSDLLEHTGSEAEAFGNVLIYFQQMASLVGESFGLEDLQEAAIQGKTINALCLPMGEQTFGVIMNARSKASEVVTQLRAAAPNL